MNIKRYIPNLFTLLNLFSGCVAIIFIFDFKFDYAFYAVCTGIFFDFFDGFFARKFGVSGALGVQLDSLADMVTCGVAPGLTMVYMLNGDYAHTPINGYLPYFGFVITLASCFRLAKFNIDTRQTDSFIGLPTPANALVIMSLTFFVATNISEFLFNKYTLIAITILSAYIMNAELPLFSLKIKNFSVQKYKLQIIFLVFAVLLLLLFQIKAIPVIIVVYVLISAIHTILSKK